MFSASDFDKGWEILDLFIGVDLFLRNSLPWDSIFWKCKTPEGVNFVDATEKVIQG